MKLQRFIKTLLMLFILTVLVGIIAHFSGKKDQSFIHIASVTEFLMIYLYLACLRTMILLGLSLYEFLTSKVLSEVTSPPLVTIIIPSYNEGKVIQASIESVSNMNYPNLEILVVDDGSPDDTFEKAMEMTIDPRVRVVTKPNGGKADALNFGIAQAIGDYVLCMDADSEIDPETIKYAMPYFENDHRLAAVAGSIEIGKADNILAKFQKLEYIIGLNFYKKAQSALGMVTIVPGPIGVFKKSVILDLGGYDHDTFAEDCELTMRILMAGHNIKYCPHMVARTEAPDNLHELCTQRYRWSRGTIQAIIKGNNHLFKNKRPQLRNMFIIGYMTLETILIPTFNFIFAMFTIFYALSFKEASLIGPFFLGLILMDISISVYSIVTEKKFISLFFLSIFSRITYGFSLEIMRFYSMIDEIMGIPMKWGTLKRKGMK